MQLLSIRAAAEAALALLADEEEPETEDCQHPEERRLDMSTMGWEAWQCRDCGYEHRRSLRGEG